MTWNHRVIRHTNKNDPDHTYLAIHEVFYTNNIPDSVTQDPIEIIGDDLIEMKETLNMMLACLDHPILNYEDIVKDRSDVE